MTTNETLDFFKQLKEMGVTFYKDGSVEVKFIEAKTFSYEAMAKPEIFKTETLEDQLFNQGN